MFHLHRMKPIIELYPKDKSLKDKNNYFLSYSYS